MASTEPQGRAIGVGAVGVRPGEDEGLLSEIPAGDMFRLTAFSDEGLPEQGADERPATYYADYNMLLRDPAVELVLVGGPIELRRDLAVRALNAGRHVATPLPFAETALDAERIMKTAHQQGLIATADCPWRDDVDLLALRAALEAERPAGVSGLFFFAALDRPVAPPPPLVDLPFFSEAEPAAGPPGLLEQHGMAMLDQIYQVGGDYVKSVRAHPIGSAAGGGEGFMLYLDLRGGGWAVAQAACCQAADLPRWAVYAPQLTITACGGRADVVTHEGKRTYDSPPEPVDFWDNLYAAVRSGAAPKCPAVDIVRAMKLHEAALASAEDGLPVSV